MVDPSAIQLDPSFDGLWDELEYRGAVHVSTDRTALQAVIDGPPITFYCGFDPTALSLHLGNLVQLVLMRRLQLAGHHPLALVGGATGLIGDPKPSAERLLHEPEVVANWVSGLQIQIARFLDFSGGNPARLVNNLDWTAPLSAIDYLRDVGQHFRVGSMIKKDIVAARLNSDEGISLTEFSYMTLQGMDYLELLRRYDCVLQTGGSDQWGNLTAGTELIRKAEGVAVHALGTPLISDASGKKFGKTEGNAVWLNSDLTSPFEMYQFWLRQDDSIVIELLKAFTFLGRAEIESLALLVESAPHRRDAQRALAFEATAFVHGVDATRTAAEASSVLFGRPDLETIDPAALHLALESLGPLDVREDMSLIRVLVESRLVTSASAGRRVIAQGGVSVNNIRITDDEATLEGRLIDGRYALIRRGKASIAGVILGYQSV